MAPHVHVVGVVGDMGAANQRNAGPSVQQGLPGFPQPTVRLSTAHACALQCILYISCQHPSATENILPRQRRVRRSCALRVTKSALSSDAGPVIDVGGRLCAPARRPSLRLSSPSCDRPYAVRSRYHHRAAGCSRPGPTGGHLASGCLTLSREPRASCMIPGRGSRRVRRQTG